MTHTSSVREVWTNDEGTMAQVTARDRWPGLVQNMINDIQKTMDMSDDDGVEGSENEMILRNLQRLKGEIESDSELRPLSGESTDIASYNEKLKALGKITWRASPWLYTECYMYRYVQTLFDATSTSTWRSYDIFKRQKDDTFSASKVAVEELSNRFTQILKDLDVKQANNKPDPNLLFTEMIQIALWGNSTDLSLLSHLSLDQIQSLQGAQAIKANQRNIIVNDTLIVWDHISKGLEQVDIVLDNAGFEFFTDLLFASYLLQMGLSKRVILHTKSFPWFVSDVTPSDVNSILDQMINKDTFPDQATLAQLSDFLRIQMKLGKISFQNHPFWTTAFDFHHLPSEAPDLFDQLRQSDLVIFKGDLNYRKLTADGSWPYTTNFKTALGKMGEGSGIKVLALRTNKADVCVGLSSQAEVERLEKEAPNAGWVKNGKYAVISFSDGA